MNNPQASAMPESMRDAAGRLYSKLQAIEVSLDRLSCPPSAPLAAEKATALPGLGGYLEMCQALANHLDERLARLVEIIGPI